MTPKLWLITRMYPHLRDLMQIFTEHVLQNVPPQRKEKILNFRGTRDIKVPPPMSIIDGTANEEFKTPPGIFSSHSYNIKEILGLSRVREFIAATLND